MLSFSRFAYVCFATGLLKEGLALLHWSTILMLLAMCVIAALIYPFRCFLETQLLMIKPRFQDTFLMEMFIKTLSKG